MHGKSMLRKSEMKFIWINIKLWTLCVFTVIHTVESLTASLPIAQCSPSNHTQLQQFLAIIQEMTSAHQEKDELAKYPFNATLCKDLAHLKPHLDREPQKWQDVAHRKLKVFSAYVERRIAADGPAIRIIGTGFQEQFNDVGDLYCHLWYEDRKYPISVGPVIYNRIYPSIAHPDMWVSHFVICKLPKDMAGTPYAVSVVRSSCDTPTNQLQVLNREHVEKTDTHALCISPMYNNFREWEMVVEWIEMHKLIGAAEVTLYNFSVTPQTNNMLKSYLKKSEITINVIQWPYPPLKSNVWCQRGALNDCLYRMGHRHRYVTITDMDEILVPRIGGTWPKLIGRLHKQFPDTGAFLFQHAYFRRNSSDERPYLITQSSFWRTDVVTPPGKIRCKAMYTADKAVSIDLHFPYLLVPGAKELMLDPEDGMLHHYRPYPMETFIKQPDKFTFIEDRFMTKYSKKLKMAVMKRHTLIKGL